MIRLWQHYLEQVFPIENIDQVVVYTDLFRIWLTEGLLDLAAEEGWQSQLMVIDEITDEEGMEIRQSLPVLSDNCLLVVLLSAQNPVINELQAIFPLLDSPFGFRGYYLIGHQHLADQYFLHHLGVDLLDALDLAEDLHQIFSNDFELDIGSSLLSGSVTSSAVFPFAQRRNAIFPATEMVVGLSRLDGTLENPTVIGKIIQQGELVDPFGKIKEPLRLLVEAGEIVDVAGDRFLVSRLKRVLSDFDQLQLSIGLGGFDEITGLLEHDRLQRGRVTISFIDRELGSYLEVMIGEYPLKSL